MYHDIERLREIRKKYTESMPIEDLETLSLLFQLVFVQTIVEDMPESEVKERLNKVIDEIFEEYWRDENETKKE